MTWHWLVPRRTSVYYVQPVPALIKHVSLWQLFFIVRKVMCIIAWPHWLIRWLVLAHKSAALVVVMVKALPCRRTKGSGSLYSYEEVRPALQCDKRLVATPQRPRRILPESYNHVSLGNVDKSQAAFGDKARMFQSHASVALPFDVAAQILHGEPPRMSIRI